MESYSIIAEQISILRKINKNLLESDSDPEQIRRNSETILRLMYVPLREGLKDEIENELKSFD